MPLEQGHDLRDGPRELEHLVARCLAGEEAAWSQLLGRYERLIYAVIRRIGFVDPDGADVYQRVAITLYEKLGTVRNLEHLAAWIITTTRRECLRERRRLARERSARAGEEEAAELADPKRLDTGVERLIELARIADEVQKLPAPCRELLTLLFLDQAEPSYTYISSRLGLPIGSIGPNRARCLAELKRRLGRRGRVRTPGKPMG